MDFTFTESQTRTNPEAGRYILPSFDEKLSDGYRTHDPYSRLFKERVIFVGAGIDDIVASDVVSQLLVLESQDKKTPITFYLNSTGGDLNSVGAIVDTIGYLQSPITTICVGKVDTPAALILAAGTPGKRMALQNSRTLLYQPQHSGFRGQATDISIMSKEMTRNRRWVEKALASLTGQDVEKVREDIERNYFLTSEEALEYGLIDTIIKGRFDF